MNKFLFEEITVEEVGFMAHPAHCQCGVNHEFEGLQIEVVILVDLEVIVLLLLAPIPKEQIAKIVVIAGEHLN